MARIFSTIGRLSVFVALVGLVAGGCTHRPEGVASRADAEGVPTPSGEAGKGLGLDSLDEPAPDFLVHPAGAAPQSFASLAAGHPVLLHLWATWCTSCRAELPDLAAFASGLAGDGVRFLAVAVEDESARPAVHRFLAGLALPPGSSPVPELLVPPSAPDVAPYLTWGLPVTYLLDARGTVVGRALGARTWSATRGAKTAVLARLKRGG